MTVQLLEGPYKGARVEAMNLLQGNLELEWFYRPGEKALVGYSAVDGRVIAARMLEPMRQGPTLWLIGAFFAVVLLFAGWTGARALLSFCFTVAMLWKILLPSYLQGKVDPVLVALGVVALLCFITLFLVAGFTRKGFSAFLGALSGCLVTWGVLLLFGGSLKLNGTTADFSTALAFSGFERLNLLRLCYAAVILSATGAMMDVSMDIAAAMSEIVEKRPDSGRLELIQSGFNIGRAVIGTMTTTLLLAYSGSALTMLMFLMAKGMAVGRILNMNHLAAETLKTISGTIGLTLVAPLTAVISAYILVPAVRPAPAAPKGERRAAS